jgi:hypothetical protein
MIVLLDREVFEKDKMVEGSVFNTLDEAVEHAKDEWGYGLDSVLFMEVSEDMIKCVEKQQVVLKNYIKEKANNE